MTDRWWIDEDDEAQRDIGRVCPSRDVPDVRLMGAPPSSFQTTQPHANPSSIQNRWAFARQLSPTITRPLVLSETPHHAHTAPTPRELSQLLRSLTSRDLVILKALHDYRYLDTQQITDLFFPSLRSAQARLKQLRTLGVLYRWRLINRPGLTWLHSLCLLSPRGARILAAARSDDPAPYVERARQAQAYVWRAPHDLEANGFMTWLACEARDHRDRGLYTWVGEDTMRAEYRQNSASKRDRVPSPDALGIYLAGNKRYCFKLEWDRGTERYAPLREKVKAFIDFLPRFSDVATINVLFVVPDAGREEVILKTADRLGHVWMPDAETRQPKFWTTTRALLFNWGPLAAIWRSRVDELFGAFEPPQRTHFLELASSRPHADEDPERAIARPGWWDRRPGGGEVT